MTRSGDYVFVLYHEHADDVLEGGLDSKMIGIYAAEAAAAEARTCAAELEGFRDHPEGFMIVPVRLDDSLWEGHIRIF